MSTAWSDRVESGVGHVGSGAIEAAGRCCARLRREKLVTGDAFDHKHELRAERTLDLSCGCGLRWWSGVEQRAATQQRSGPVAVGEQAEVTDANEALGQTWMRNRRRNSSAETVMIFCLLPAA